MDKIRIAIASSDGIVVNNHFGKAKIFYIYQAENESVSLLEQRQVEPVCDYGNHDEERLIKNLEIISDCDYLLVSRIGDGARHCALSMGITSFEIPGIIEKSIEKLIKYIKIQKLFE